MGIREEVDNGTTSMLYTQWARRSGQVVPETRDVALSNGAVEVDATYLYADMAGSTTLAQLAQDDQTARIIRSYLNSAVRIINYYGGEIRSFDGDRVMAIFMNKNGNKNKSNKAVRTALAINWAVEEVLRPKIEAKYPGLSKSWTLSHGIGVDTGHALITRGGVRNNNDLISIGSSPNVAAKLSEYRGSHVLYISGAVQEVLFDSNKLDPVGQSMWSKLGPVRIGGRLIERYASNWYWGPGY